MSAKVPKSVIIGVVLLVTATILGVGVWWFTKQQLAEAQERLDDSSRKLMAITGGGIFPNPQNLQKLEELNEGLESRVLGVLPVMAERAEVFSEFLISPEQGLSPDQWKLKLSDIRESLRNTAQEKGVEMSDDFYLGFRRYRIPAPPATATAQLGIQLVGAKELTRIMIDAQVSEIRELRRVMVEDSETLRTAAVAGDEVLAAQVLQGQENWYDLYPFEIRFRATPSAALQVVNELVASEVPFIVRFVQLENERPSVPRRTEISTRVQPGESKLLIPVSGQEQVIVRIRTDLIHWKKQDAAVKNGDAS